MDLSSSRTGRRLGAALLVYLLAVTAIITLAPFRFAVPTGFRIWWAAEPQDVVLNVGLFLPLGFLYSLARGRRIRDRGAAAFLLGLGASAVFESAQLFELDRFASPVDVLTNGLGAWLGAQLYLRLSRSLDLTPELVGKLGLELPLMGLAYLLVPLLWVDGLALGHASGRVWLAVLVGLSGAVILGTVYRHHFGPARLLPPQRMGLIAGAWFLAGSIPAALFRPSATLATAALVTAVCWLVARVQLPAGADRRYETATLGRMLPLFGCYLLLVAAWPFTLPRTTWQASSGLDAPFSGAPTLTILRLLEYMAGLTLLGYIVAEFRGRLEQSFWRTARWLFGIGGVTVLVLELLAGFTGGRGASGVRLVLALGAVGCGGGIYHLFRSHIRWLLGALRQTGPVSPADRAASSESGQSAAPGWATRRG